MLYRSEANPQELVYSKKSAIAIQIRTCYTNFTMKKILLLAAGFIMLGLGAIGAFIPVFPTTPFVIVAAGCFSASSPKLYQKLQNSPFFGEYISGIREKKPISTKARVQGITVLWVMLIVSALIVRRPLVCIILAVVGVSVTIHLLTIRRNV
jgi:uncharacterized membrane protein YbaN (DUF454 family)